MNHNHQKQQGLSAVAAPNTRNSLVELNPNGPDMRPVPINIHPASPRPYCSRARNAGLPVLIIVEDDANDFLLLRLALSKAGVTAPVWWAQSGQEAIAILDDLQNSRASICVVIDLRLPDMTGFALMGQIKARKAPSDVKCVVLTGTSDKRSEHLAYAYGADAFFTKPCSTPGLIEIARALQKLAAGQMCLDPRRPEQLATVSDGTEQGKSSSVAVA